MHDGPRCQLFAVELRVERRVPPPDELHLPLHDAADLVVPRRQQGWPVWLARRLGIGDSRLGVRIGGFGVRRIMVIV